MKKSEKYIDHIVSELKHGRLIPFIGSGVSYNAIQKDWKSLAAALSEDLGQNFNKYDPITIAQFYTNTKDERRLYERVRKELTPNPDKELDLEIQKQIAKWPTKTIITTNFENFLEKAYKKIGKNPNVIHLNNTRDWSTFEGVKIFKIHGDLEHTPMILTQQDYLDYEKDHPAAFHLLQSLFYTRTILFIGCSLADPNFRRAYFGILSNFTRGQSRHYALFPKINEVESKMWEKFGITPITFSCSNNNIRDKLFNLVEEIANRCQHYQSGISGRNRIFEEFEKIYDNKRKASDLTIRKETESGFLYCPLDKKINIFKNFLDGKDRQENSIERKKTYLNFIKNNATMKLIISIKAKRLGKRGFSGFEEPMLRSIMKIIQDNISNPNFQVVERVEGLEYLNRTIYNDDVMIESYPLRSKNFYQDRLRTVVEKEIITYMKNLFDDNFDFFINENLTAVRNKKNLNSNISKKMIEIDKSETDLEDIEKNYKYQKNPTQYDEKIKELKMKLSNTKLEIIKQHLTNEIENEINSL